MKYNNVKYEIENHVGVITISRPEKLNALNRETLEEVNSLLDTIEADESKIIIITGSGEKAFVAGADINEISVLDDKTAVQFAESGQKVFNRIEQLGKPVIAAVNGFALGGGCELALACHMRIASENARFGQPEIKLGIIPGYGGTQRLPRIIGLPRAIEYSLTGDMIDARTAERIGLVNKVVSAETLMQEARELAVKIAGFSSPIIKYMLNSIIEGKDKNIADGLKHEAGLFGQCCGTNDFKEGTKAFLEKRKPAFNDR